MSKLSFVFREVTAFFHENENSRSRSYPYANFRVSTYPKMIKLESGAPERKSASRGTKSTTFAKGIFQPSNVPKLFCCMRHEHLAHAKRQQPFSAKLAPARLNNDDLLTASK